MEERLRIEQDGTHFELSGEFDTTDVGAVEAALSTTNGSSIVVDLSEVTFVDSSALRCLVAQRKAHPGLRYVRPSPHLVRIAEITGTTDLLFAD